METTAEIAPRLASRAVRHADDLRRTREALTVWIQQQPDSGPGAISEILAPQAVRFLRWYSRQPAYRGAQLPSGLAIVAPKSLHNVSLRCVKIWNTDTGNAAASWDDDSDAESDDGSMGSLDLDTDEDTGSSEMSNPFSSTEVRTTCAEYAMSAGKLGFLSKAAKAIRREKVVWLLAHLWGQAQVTMRDGKHAESVWIYQLGTAACVMQQINARAGDVRCLTLHQLILPGQESGSGLIACVHAAYGNLPIPDLVYVPGHTKTFFEVSHQRFSLPAHEVDFMSPATWAGMLVFAAKQLGSPVENYLLRQRRLGANMQKSPTAFTESPVSTTALCRGFRKYLDDIGQLDGETCHSFRTGGAVCLAAAGLHAGQVSAELYQAQATSAYSYMAAHVKPRIPWQPCPCCKHFLEDAPAQKLMLEVSEAERRIDAARAHSNSQA